MQCGSSHLQTVQENILSHVILGVITPNQIPLTTMVTYLQKVTEAEFQTIGPLYLHAVRYLPFTNSPRKHSVTYHFSDLQEVYSGNRQIHTKCQLQYLHPPQISTSGKCHCVIIHQTTKASEYIGIYTRHHCHIYVPITAFVTFTPYKFDCAPRTLTWQSLDLVQCHLKATS